MNNQTLVTNRDELCLIFELCSDLLASGQDITIAFAASPKERDQELVDLARSINGEPTKETT